jgi:hypothetical protein
MKSKTNKVYKESMKQKVGSLKKMNKIDKPLAKSQNGGGRPKLIK